MRGLQIDIGDRVQFRAGYPELDIPRVDPADPSGPNYTHIDFIHRFFNSFNQSFTR
jgi:hypothetical protein